MASLEAKYRELSLANHPDRNPADRVGAASRTANINEAFKVLKHPVRRAFYLLGLKGVDLEKVSMPMEFLEGILEQREALEAAMAEKNFVKVRGLAAQIERDSAVALSAGQASLRAGDVAAATSALAKVRYFGRFLEEVEAIEEDAA
ncbi:MAG: Fe-S protein assembly co-chaperone HscB [Myxococcaceae bacterium]|nr:Fe-S protein assembly co-chaperone HscB [Myxococcaceae bacterium]